MHPLRHFIKILLEEEDKKSQEEKEDLLTEPDETDGRPEKEASSGGVAGATVPLGASSANYPSRTNIRLPPSKVDKKNSKNG